MWIEHFSLGLAGLVTTLPNDSNHASKLSWTWSKQPQRPRRRVVVKMSLLPLRQMQGMAFKTSRKGLAPVAVKFLPLLLLEITPQTKDTVVSVLTTGGFA